MYSYCNKCVSDKSLCSQCRDNPEVQKILASLPKQSFFMNYVPVCPRGYLDCVCDPAYIKYHYPDWYANLYGDKTPEEAIYKEGGCWDSFINDPDEKYYCYDDMMMNREQIIMSGVNEHYQSTHFFKNFQDKRA